MPSWSMTAQNVTSPRATSALQIWHRTEKWQKASEPFLKSVPDSKAINLQETGHVAHTAGDLSPPVGMLC